MNLLGLVPLPWRLAGIAALAAVAFGTGWVHGLERGEDKLEQFKEAAARAGDEQNARTAAQIQAWKTDKEISDAKALDAAAARDAALERERLRQLADAHRRIVPGRKAGAGGDSRICFADRDELDRRIRESVGRLRERIVRLAAEGQRGVDVAAQCRAWSAGLAR